MPDSSRRNGTILRLVPLLGIGLLAYLILKVNVHALATNAKAIGWGLLLVIALGGFSHVVKTWAWRLTMRGERRNVSFARALGLRLASEAFGQLGFVGMVGGETTRISLLGSAVSHPAAISSVTLDRGLFIITGAVVTLAGLAGVGIAVPLPHTLRLYTAGLVIVLVCLLVAGAIAIQGRWRVLSGSARAIAWIPGFKKWLGSRELTLIASEQRILAFYHEAPSAFWCSVILNLFCHFLAIAEVYICLKMLGTHATLADALIMESLTKLINVAGSVNPGNVGTYEAGNMAIGKLVRLTGTQACCLHSVAVPGRSSGRSLAGSASYGFRKSGCVTGPNSAQTMKRAQQRCRLNIPFDRSAYVKQYSFSPMIFPVPSSSSLPWPGWQLFRFFFVRFWAFEAKNVSGRF